MKKNFQYLLLLPLVFLLTSCLKDECTETRTFVEFVPVYRTEAQMTALPQIQSPRALRDPGILYVYGKYLLVNEFREGVHIYDNSDPSNPINLAFLSIEGNEHFAVSHNRMQANKFDALITIDLSDLQNPRQTSRIENVFGEPQRDARGTLVYYQETERKVTLDCDDPNFNNRRWRGNNGTIFFDAEQLSFAGFDASRLGSSPVGTGGSTARFTISKNHLYTVSEFDLTVYDLSNPSIPDLASRHRLGWGIETIYPFKDQLFVGSNTGMFIFDISTPQNPLLQSQFEHVRACDPVVADDNTAYVTLREGTICEGFTNQLDVIDIENVFSPFLIRSYSMIHPHGLSLQGNHLYICEGDFGLKVLDVSDRSDIKEIDHLRNVEATDVIALSPQHLLVVGGDGLRQYDSSNPKRLEMLSRIPIELTD